LVVRLRAVKVTAFLRRLAQGNRPFARQSRRRRTGDGGLVRVQALKEQAVLRRLAFAAGISLAMRENKTSRELIAADRELAVSAGRLKFGLPVTHVYNPLDYARAPHELYLKKYGGSRKRVIFIGMNPGPFGMTQTGVPFGEVAAVRDWLKISAKINKPAGEHAKRLIQGFDCLRSEVSGRRLWGLFAERFGTPENFFAEHFVANYCPLAFCESSGSNRTPDKLPPAERHPLLEICDAHLRRVLEILDPEWLIGVGDFAAKRARSVCDQMRRPIRIGQILHPSPASPMANRGWAQKATEQLIELGVW
jgi:single-strand selective monofunctional uracil DNA glycosylase